MARKTYVELIDDTNGEKADECVTFGLDGINYEIDLTEENARALREELSKWISSARRQQHSRKSRSTSGSSNSDTAKIRVWARENGKQVSDRGRISKEIREEYYAAH